MPQGRALDYTARILIHRQGPYIHSEFEPFSHRQLAVQWIRVVPTGEWLGKGCGSLG